MKDFLKDYGTLIGPVFAFTLGVFAIYIKFYADRQLDNWRSRKKLGKLILLIRNSDPPAKYYPHPHSEPGDIPHADQVRNIQNMSIFIREWNTDD
jgi:hypothetical protein